LDINHIVTLHNQYCRSKNKSFHEEKTKAINQLLQRKERGEKVEEFNVSAVVFLSA